MNVEKRVRQRFHEIEDIGSILGSKSLSLVSVCDYPPAKYIKSDLLKLVFSPYMDTVLYFKLILHEILQSGLSNDMYFIGKLSLTLFVSLS